jgi:hypothetical protein
LELPRGAREYEHAGIRYKIIKDWPRSHEGTPAGPIDTDAQEV